MNKKKPAKQKVLYEELTPGEFKVRLADAPIAYLPLGTLEWHGEHMPLGSDGIQPFEFFKEVAAEVGGIVLPALFLGPDKMEMTGGLEYYGKDLGNHPDAKKQQYEKQILTGSIYWIPDSLFISIVENILKQLKRQGFKILVTHGHGPSIKQIIKHSAEWESASGIKIFHLWGAENDEWEGFMSDHGAMLETSVVMKYRPELVYKENLPKDMEVWPVGIRGHDPRLYASAQKGEEIVKITKKRIINLLKEELGKLTTTY
jgi:creatinine amidohydrolase